MTRNDATGTTRPNTPIAQLSPAVVEAHLIAQDATLLDVRDVDQLAARGWIPGALHLPLEQLTEHLEAADRHPARLDTDRLDTQRLTIVHDEAGSRCLDAAQALIAQGHTEVAVLAGGIVAWEQDGYPVAGRAAWHPRITQQGDRVPSHVTAARRR